MAGGAAGQGGAGESRSVERFLEPLLNLPGVRTELLGPIQHSNRSYPLPRFIFSGPNNSDPIRIALFGGIHGDEPAGALALARLLSELIADPQPAENFELHFYPICNPSGFEEHTRESRSGRDLNREFWKNSTEPEVRILERELRANHFSGIVQLHADDGSDGVYGYVRGHTLTENLLRPALEEAGRVLPRNRNATIDGFAARDGIIYHHYDGILAAPAEMKPMPFEIVLETPQRAEVSLQVEALVTALRTILREYRRLVSFAANI